MQKNNPTTSYRMDLKTKILSCALKNFREKGIKAVKMDDIANQLSISKRTLYEIFNKKEDLLFACVKYNDEILSQRMCELKKEDDTVMDILVSFMRMHFVENSHTSPLLYVELPKYPQVMHFIREKQEMKRSQSMAFIHRGVEEGFFRDDVNYTIVNRMVEVFMHNVMENKYYDTFPMAEISKTVILTLLRGFCTEKGLRQIEALSFDTSGE